MTRRRSGVISLTQTGRCHHSLAMRVSADTKQPELTERSIIKISDKTQDLSVRSERLIFHSAHIILSCSTISGRKYVHFELVAVAAFCISQPSLILAFLRIARGLVFLSLYLDVLHCLQAGFLPALSCILLHPSALKKATLQHDPANTMFDHRDPVVYITLHLGQEEVLRAPSSKCLQCLLYDMFQTAGLLLATLVSVQCTSDGCISEICSHMNLCSSSRVITACLTFSDYRFS